MRRFLLSVLVVGLVGCAGHAEWARRGDGEGELTLKGDQDSAFRDAQAQIASACGNGNAEIDRNTISNGRLLSGRGGSGMVHYKCRPASAAK